MKLISNRGHSSSWQPNGTLTRWISLAVGKIRQSKRRAELPLFNSRLAISRGGGTRKHAARRFAMLRPDMNGNQPNRGSQHGGIVGEADERQHVGNEVERQHEIRQRAEQGDLNPARGVTIEGAEIGCDQILGKRKPRGEPPELWPEFAAHAGFLARHRGVVLHVDSVNSERWPAHNRPSGARVDLGRAANVVRKPGDHKGRPYSEQCCRGDPCGRPFSVMTLVDALIPSDWLKRSTSPKGEGRV